MHPVLLWVLPVKTPSSPHFCFGGRWKAQLPVGKVLEAEGDADNVTELPEDIVLFAAHVL